MDASVGAGAAALGAGRGGRSIVFVSFGGSAEIGGMGVETDG